MNLSIEQKALIQTIGMLATCVIAGTSLVFALSFFSTSTMLIALGAVIMCWLVYLMYSINLSQLKYKETLEEMVDKK